MPQPVSTAPNGETFPLPTPEDYDREILSLQLLCKSQHDRGRQAVLVMGVGFVGAVMAGVVADAWDDEKFEKSFTSILNILKKHGMKLYHNIKNVRFKSNHLILDIDGKKHAFDLKKISQPLLHASEIERTTFEISPSGYGIHWPLIDEDISIDGLLGIVHSPDFVFSS